MENGKWKMENIKDGLTAEAVSPAWDFSFSIFHSPFSININPPVLLK
jgi:hypothetical protein